MKYRIRHETQYIYSAPVTLSQNQARLTPLHIDNQQCTRSLLTIYPTPSYRDTYLDACNNLVTHFDITVSHQELRVVTEHEVQILPQGQLELGLPHVSWEQVRDSIRDAKNQAGVQILWHTFPTEYTQSTPSILAYTLQVFKPGRDFVDACHDLMHRLYTDLTFDSQSSNVMTKAADTMTSRKGVCQDFVHLALACLRSIGLAAKYVSGYIETLPPEGKEKLVGADATHAWFAVYAPGLGWMEFDPTNDIVPAEQHIKLATGRDYHDVAPLRGLVFGGGQHQLNVAVDMNRIE